MKNILWKIRCYLITKIAGKNMVILNCDVSVKLKAGDYFYTLNEKCLIRNNIFENKYRNVLFQTVKPSEMK